MLLELYSFSNSEIKSRASVWGRPRWASVAGDRGGVAGSGHGPEQGIWPKGSSRLGQGDCLETVSELCQGRGDVQV